MRQGCLVVNIPFNKLYTCGREMEYMRDCLDRGQIAGDGRYTGLVHDFIQQRFGGGRVFLTTSGTAALEMAALLIDLQPGDEVLMPSFAFASAANAVMLRGARPVFVDIDPATLNIAAEMIEARITGRTRAIMPVHYAGVACAMDEIMSIAGRHQLMVIEDAAQAVNATYRGRHLGTVGQLGCFSFHATKNIACGEGGALLLNTADPVMIERADILWEKGTNRRQFLLGRTDRYTWMDVGSSYLPADLLAAFLYAQLEQMEEITARRRCIYEYYFHALQSFADSGLVGLPHLPGEAGPNYHIFYCIFKNRRQRDWVMDKLAAIGIQSTFHFVPLHSSPMGIRLGYQASDLPVTEDLSSRLLRLPLYPDLSPAELEYISQNLGAILRELEKNGAG